MTRYILPLFLIVTVLSGCFKNNPRKESFKAAGSWKLDEVSITKYDVNGNESSTELQKEAGFLMLSFGDDFMYENGFSYSLNTNQLNNSEIYPLFQIADMWNVTVDGKAFNLGLKDASTGFVQFVGSLTVNKLSKKRMELQYVELDPTTEQIIHSEIWKLKSATH
jgi:hypothetical protein